MDMNHIGRQPGAVQPTRKRKKHAYAVMVSVLTGLFLLTAVSGALRLAGIIYFPWEPNAIGSSAAIYGPATVFGLCPQEGSVSLLSERIFFSDQGQDAIEYRVSLDEKASFLLPVARRYQRDRRFWSTVLKST